MKVELLYSLQLPTKFLKDNYIYYPMYNNYGREVQRRVVSWRGITLYDENNLDGKVQV